MIQNNSLIWPMKHHTKKCKKDSWKIQNVKCNNLHRFAQKCSKIYKNAHRYVQKTTQWLLLLKPWACQ